MASNIPKFHSQQCVCRPNSITSVYVTQSVACLSVYHDTDHSVCSVLFPCRDCTASISPMNRTPRLLIYFLSVEGAKRYILNEFEKDPSATKIDFYFAYFSAITQFLSNSFGKSGLFVLLNKWCKHELNPFQSFFQHYQN